jgi:hypothetical protein
MAKKKDKGKLTLSKEEISEAVAIGIYDGFWKPLCFSAIILVCIGVAIIFLQILVANLQAQHCIENPESCDNQLVAVQESVQKVEIVNSISTNTGDVLESCSVDQCVIAYANDIKCHMPENCGNTVGEIRIKRVYMFEDPDASNKR